MVWDHHVGLVPLCDRGQQVNGALLPWLSVTSLRQPCRLVVPGGCSFAVHVCCCINTIVPLTQEAFRGLTLRDPSRDLLPVP